MRKINYLLFCMVLSMLAGCKQKVSNLSFDMIKVDDGKMLLGYGNTNSYPNYVYGNNNVEHEVELSDFYMAKNLITVKEWKEFLKDSKLEFDWNKTISLTFNFALDFEYFKLTDLFDSDLCPIQAMDWYYACAFCNWASKKDGLKPVYKIRKSLLKETYGYRSLDYNGVKWNKKANGYRLPTAAEWEYAARGGQKSKGYKFAGSDIYDDVGKINQRKTYQIGQYKPNELGLYDMTGNVSVWCWDWSTLRYIPTNEKNPSVDSWKVAKKNWEENGFGWQPTKVVFGCSYYYQNIESCYCYRKKESFISNMDDTIGIRLVRNSN